MIAAVTNLSPAQAVAEASEWWYFGRNYSYPRYNRIAAKAQSGETEEVPRASEVFVALGLAPSDLRGVFWWSARETISTFEELGACPPADENWSELARITGKIIHFVQCSGETPGCGYEHAVYYPDGRIDLK